LGNKEALAVVVLAGAPKDNVFVVVAVGVKELPKSGVVVEGADVAVDVPPNKLFVCCGCVVLSDPKDKLG
jgi:hypothetical protein